MSGTAGRKTTALSLDPRLFGGRPDKLLEFMGLRGTPNGTGGVWDVRTEEAYEAQRPDLVTVLRLDDRRRGGLKEELLRRLTAIAPDLEQGHAQQVRDFNDRMVARLEAGNDLTAMLSLYHLNLMTCHDEELPSLMVHIDNTVRNWKFSGDGSTAFPDARTYIVAPTNSLRHRGRLPAVMLRFEQDPELAANLAGVSTLPEGETFASATGMMTGTTLLDTFVAPLLGCASPRIWGFHAVRSIGVIVFAFGITLRGVSSDPVEPLQLLPRELSHERVLEDEGGEVFDGFTASACDDAIHWWSLRINQMCAYISDPVVFSDHAGRYSGTEHLNWLLTFEQLFRRASAVQTEHRNVAARRTLAFGALDIVGDRLLDSSIEDLCRLKRAEKVLRSLESTMAPGVATILLPQARRAVDALRELQQGFFIARHRSKSTVDIILSNGETRSYDLDRATAKFIAVLRNSTHGFGSKPGRASMADSTTILAHHNGQVPPDVYLLAYLYLLDILCNPDRIKVGIARKVASPVTVRN